MYQSFTRRLKIVCLLFGMTLVFTGNPVGRPEYAQAVQQQAPVYESYPEEISAKEVASKITAGAYILDVRELYEFERGHILEAVLIPFGRLKDRVNELPKDRDIVVVCLSGGRSRVAIKILRQAGYEKSSSLAGGMNAWKAAGYPVKTGR